jgi:outer membrane protein assembly factor BamD
MTRPLTLAALAFLCLLPAARADFSLNPLSWFKDPPEESFTASPAEEAEAGELLQEGIARMEAGREGAAHRIFKRVAKNYPATSAAADALFYRAQMLRKDGHRTKAFEALQEIILLHPSYPHFNRVVAEQFEIATELMEGARGRIFGVVPGFRKYDKAVDYFTQIVRNSPYGDYAPLSLMNIAIIAKRRGDADTAIDALDRLINNYPQSMLAPDAYQRLAQTYADLVKGHEYDQGSTREAIRYYEDFLILFPRNEKAGEVEASLRDMENLLAQSRLNIGDFYYIYRNNNTAALVFYNEAIDLAPDSESAAEARERIADIEAGVRPATGYRLARRLLFLD